MISARSATRAEREQFEEGTAKRRDELLREYDLSQLKGGDRGKYYRRATEGTNMVLIDPGLANLFPDSDAVNRALRLLAEAAQAATIHKSRRPRLS